MPKILLSFAAALAACVLIAQTGDALASGASGQRADQIAVGAAGLRSLPADGVVVRVGAPVRVVVRRPRMLSLRVSGVPRSGVRLGLVAVARVRKGRWVLLPSKPVRDGRRVTARVSRTGIYAPVRRGAGVGFGVDDVRDALAGATSELVYRFNRFTNLRAARPDCSRRSPVPSWARTNTTQDPNASILSCGAGEDGVAVVELANNRPYGVIIEFPVPVKWAWVERGFSLRPLNQVPYRFVDGFYLSALSRASVGVAQGDWETAGFMARPSNRAIFYDTVEKFAETITGAAVGSLGSTVASKRCIDLAYTFASSSGSAGELRGGTAEIGNAVVECVSSAVAEGRLAGADLKKAQKGIARWGAAIGVARYVATYGDLIAARAVGLEGGFSVSRVTPPPLNGEPKAVTLSVSNLVTNGSGMREDPQPAYLSTLRQNACKRRGCAVPGTERTSGQTYAPAVCQAQGERVTNGNDSDAADDANQQRAESTRWYGVRAGDGAIHFVSEIWIQPSQRGGLGLPGCA